MDKCGVDFPNEKNYNEHITYRMTSDEMFRTMPKDKKWDLIFIDGYHSEGQSKMDIVHSMAHLSENGFLMVHDILPREEKYCGDQPIYMEWSGNVYKSILDLNKIRVKYVTVANGVDTCIIPHQKLSEGDVEEYLQPSNYTYEDYERDNRSAIHIVPTDKIFRKIAIYHNSEYLEQHPMKDSNGKTCFGGTEEWVYGIAEELGKRCFDVTVFTDKFPEIEHTFAKYSKRFTDDMFSHYDCAMITTDVDVSNQMDADVKILLPTCELFNTSLSGEVFFSTIGFLSEHQQKRFENIYGIQAEWTFRHFLPCRSWLYENYADYTKENAMVWSSAPVRGLRFFIERVMPRIRCVFPDFKLYICGYTKNHYEEDWASYCRGVQGMVNANREELAELQKKCKIWVYPNLGRSDSTGLFYETYCITSVENAMAGNAVVCLGGKDGISSTLEGYEGFIDGGVFNESDENFTLQYERVAEIMALQAIKILSDDKYRVSLANNARKICEKYTWGEEVRIIMSQI